MTDIHDTAAILDVDADECAVPVDRGFARHLAGFPIGGPVDRRVRHEAHRPLRPHPHAGRALEVVHRYREAGVEPFQVRLAERQAWLSLEGGEVERVG